jgi:hypothetical protein
MADIDEMPNRVTEYRISPLVDGWMTEEKAVATLKAWGSIEHGAPAVTVTKRTITNGNDTAVTTTPVDRPDECGDVDPTSGNVCRRSPSHTYPHRDAKQKGTETSSWWGDRPLYPEPGWS